MLPACAPPPRRRAKRGRSREGLQSGGGSKGAVGRGGAGRGGGLEVGGEVDEGVGELLRRLHLPRARARHAAARWGAARRVGWMLGLNPITLFFGGMLGSKPYHTVLRMDAWV
jgi:hypothetical protein